MASQKQLRTLVKQLQITNWQLQLDLASVKEKLAGFQDYRTEVIDGGDLLVTEKALKLVKELDALVMLNSQNKAATACIQFDADDGPEDYQTIESLRELADFGTMRLIHCSTYAVTQQRTTSEIQSGHYVLMDNN